MLYDKIYATHKWQAYVAKFSIVRRAEMNCQEKIKELRKRTGMNRKEFCAHFGIPYQTVTDWERGQRRAPDYVLRLLEYYVRMQMMKEDAR